MWTTKGMREREGGDRSMERGRVEINKQWLLRSARGNFPSYSKCYLREFHIDLKEKSSTKKIVRGGFILLFLPMSPCLLIRVENASSYGQSKTKEVVVCDIPQPIFEPIKFFWLHARFGNGWTVTIFFLSPSRTLAAPECKHYFAWPSIVISFWNLSPCSSRPNKFNFTAISFSFTDRFFIVPLLAFCSESPQLNDLSFQLFTEHNPRHFLKILEQILQQLATSETWKSYLKVKRGLLLGFGSCWLRSSDFFTFAPFPTVLHDNLQGKVTCTWF